LAAAPYSAAALVQAKWWEKKAALFQPSCLAFVVHQIATAPDMALALVYLSSSLDVFLLDLVFTQIITNNF